MCEGIILCGRSFSVRGKKFKKTDIKQTLYKYKGMKLICACLFLFISLASASLEEFSKKVNGNLPEIYDPVTKLMRSTIENNLFVYHFLVDATPEEFKTAFPKVQSQIRSSACRLKTERTVLTQYKTGIEYRYENVKGQSLGSFIIRPDFCR